MPVPTRSLHFYLALGLVQGLVLFTLYKLRLPLLTATVGTAVIVLGTHLQLLGDAVKSRGTWVLVLVHAALLAALSGWLNRRESTDWLWEGWFFGLPMLAYICTAFILSWPTREGNRPRYADLFQHAWNTAFVIALAWLLCGLFMLLLWLCGALFEMLHVPQPAELFREPAFLFVTLPVVFSVGMRMGAQNDRVIGLLRGILLTLCRFLLPLAAAITVLFTVALPFTGVQPIWDTGYSTTILLSLAGALLFLVNGVFQDGEQHAYPQALRRLVEASLLCLPVLIGLAGWSTWLRIDQYGLMPSRILAALYVLVAMLHSLAAVWAVFASRRVWLGTLCTSNVALALLSAVLIVLFFTPVLDPMGHSARSQMQRLVSGRTAVNEFDVGAFRYRLGVEGHEQLQALQGQLERGEILDAPDRAALLARLKDFDDTGRRSSPVQLEWLGPVEPGGEKLREIEFLGPYCREPGCVLWPVDLNGDGRNEVVVISRRKHAGSAPFYERDQADNWREAGMFSDLAGNALIEQVRAGKVEVVTPSYKTLKLDGKELNIRLEMSR